MRDCVAFVSHIANAPVRRVFERLEREAPAELDVFFLLSSDAAPEKEGPPVGEHLVQVTRDDVLRLGYPRKCQAANWEMAGNLDLVFLEFARRHPRYERIWFVEYDVHWEGKWSVLFERFRDSDADILATTILPIGRRPDRLHRHIYPPLVLPAGPAWDPALILNGFLPICRVSRAALDALRQAYLDGLCGHYEIMLPSAAAQAGLVIEDIGGNGCFVRPENRNRFYFARAGTFSHSPGCFVFRPEQKVLPRPNTLWHPVKPERVPLWHPLRVAGNPLKTAVEWLKPLLWRGVIRLWFATRWRPFQPGAS